MEFRSIVARGTAKDDYQPVQLHSTEMFGGVELERQLARTDTTATRTDTFHTAAH